MVNIYFMSKFNYCPMFSNATSQKWKHKKRAMWFLYNNYELPGEEMLDKVISSAMNVKRSRPYIYKTSFWVERNKQKCSNSLPYHVKSPENLSKLLFKVTLMQIRKSCNTLVFIQKTAKCEICEMFVYKHTEIIIYVKK